MYSELVVFIELKKPENYEECSTYYEPAEIIVNRYIAAGQPFPKAKPLC